jgi:hypothetical protein
MFGCVKFGLVWLGTVVFVFGLVWFGLVWLGLVGVGWGWWGQASLVDKHSLCSD